MKKRKTAIGLIKLTRYQEYLLFVTITTLLGFIFSHPHISPDTIIRLVIIHIANMLSVCFSFMINDVEDAPDDALNPDKVVRNPISSGMLSRKVGLWGSWGVAILAGCSFLLLGSIPFWIGIITLILGFLYSWKVIRLKRLPIIDLISHSLMLAGLQFLGSYFTFSSFHGFTYALVLPLLLVTAISMYGELYNEVRDLTYDQMAGLTHTASLIGKKNAHLLMYTLLSIAGLSLLYSIYLQMIPLWFIILFVVLGGMFFLNFISALFTTNINIQTDDVQDYVLLVTVISLSLWTLATIVGL